MSRKKMISFEVKILSNLIARQIGNSQAIQEMEKMTGMHGWIIGFLYENRDRDLFQRDLEAEFRIRRSTATNLLNTMEQNGLVRRESVAHDGRLKRLVLTEKAVALHEVVASDIDNLEARLISGLTKEEQNTFLVLTEKLKKNMES